MPQLLEREQVGKREELADIITNIQVEACPIKAMLPKGRRPNQKLIQFQCEEYPDTGHKGVVDGTDASTFNSVGRVLLKTLTQRLWWTIKVSNFAEQSVVAGISGRGDMKHQKALALIILARMIERRLLSSSDLQEDNGTLPNETRGLMKWIQSTAQALYPVDANFLTPATSIYTGTLANFTEDEMANIMGSMYDQRKGPVTTQLACGRMLKQKISKFTTYVPDSTGQTVVRNVTQDAKSKQLIKVIDRLVFDSGTVDTFITSFLETDATTGAATSKTARSGVFLDMDMIEMAWTQMPNIEDLPNLGGGPRAIADAYIALLVKNPKGMGKVDISADV